MPNINLSILNESPFLLSEARNHIPEIRSLSQVRAWVDTGRIRQRDRGKVGRRPRIYLEVVCLTDGYATSVAAYQRFIEELNS